MITPDRLAGSLNPIIGDTPPDTLYRAACVASFLARFQMDRADALFLGKTAGGFVPDLLTVNETRGLSLLTEALSAALFFEVEGRQGRQGDAS